jgi:large subunit ribosomal protein L25
MSILLKAEKRENIGSSAAKKIKRAGRIPAVIYAKDGNINLSLDVKEFEHEYFKGNSLTSVVELELNGKKIKVIAHKVELDPVSDRPVHVDFLNCEQAKTIRAKPKLVFTNQEKSPGLKKGGFLHIVLRKVELLCESEKAIPEKIEIDVGSTQVGHKIRANNLKLPAGTKLAEKGNFLIASVIGRGKAEEEEKAAVAATDAAAIPAAGGAAGAAGTPAAGGKAATPAAGAKAAPAKDEKKK